MKKLAAAVERASSAQRMVKYFRAQQHDFDQNLGVHRFPTLPKIVLYTSAPKG